MSKYPTRETKAMYLDLFEIYHEFGEHGQHRLCIDTKVGTWARYNEIAIIEYEKRKLAGATEFWWPTLPEIFEVFEIKDHDEMFGRGIEYISDAPPHMTEEPVVEEPPKRLSVREMLERKKEKDRLKAKQEAE